MKWVFIVLIFCGAAAIAANLTAFTARVQSTYARPAKARALACQNNMQELLILADAHLPRNRNSVRLGIWHPIEDPVTAQQLNMLISYFLYPAYAVAATPESIPHLRYVTGYNGHSGSLAPVLKKLQMEGRFPLVATNSTFFLRERKGADQVSLCNPATAAGNTHGDRAEIQTSDKLPTTGIPSRFLRLLLALASFLILGRLLTSLFRSQRLLNMHGIPLLREWSVGILAATLLLPAATLLGMEPTFAMLLALAALLILAVYRQQKADSGADTANCTPHSEKGAEITAQWRKLLGMALGAALILAALVWVTEIVLESISSPVFDITGLGVWGLKAKAFFDSREQGLSLIGDSELRFCHPSYPLGFPLILAYCYTWMGTVDDWLIRLVPTVFGIGTGLLLYSACRTMGADWRYSVFAAVLFCSGETFSIHSTFLEAETLLLLLSVAGFLFLLEALRNGTDRRCLWLGMLFLSGAACTKQEGTVYFVVGSSLALWLSRGIHYAQGRNGGMALDVAVAVGIAALFVLPWQIYCRLHALPNNDFSIQALCDRNPPELLRIWWQGVSTFLRQMFVERSSGAVIWIAATAACIANWRQVLAGRQKDVTLLLLTSGILILFFGSVFVASVYSTLGYSRLHWHLEASERLLLFPTCLALLLAVRLLAGQPGTTRLPAIQAPTPHHP